jgi:hypothetical protein
VISNFKSWLAGTFHGVSVGRLQEYCDEFSWRYCHRVGDALADLLAEIARWPHVALSEIRSYRVAMTAHEPPAEPGRKRNRKILDRWLARERRLKGPLLARMAAALSAASAAEEAPVPTGPDEVPGELLDLLAEAFDEVSMFMREDPWAA